MVRNTRRKIQRRAMSRRSSRGGAWPWTNTSNKVIETQFANLDYYIRILENSGCGSSHTNNIRYSKSINRYYNASKCGSSFQKANEYIGKLENTSLSPELAKDLNTLKARLAQFQPVKL